MAKKLKSDLKIGKSRKKFQNAKNQKDGLPWANGP